MLDLLVYGFLFSVIFLIGVQVGRLIEWNKAYKRTLEEHPELDPIAPFQPGIMKRISKGKGGPMKPKSAVELRKARELKAIEEVQGG